MDTINANNYGFISLMNHGEPSSFITWGYRTDFPDADVYYHLWAIDSIHLVYNNEVYNHDTHTNNGFNNLLNKRFPSICYSIGCTTMPFDRAPNYEAVSMNVGKSFTIGKDYGGPAYLGNTRGSFYSTANRLECLFAEELLIGNYKVGSAEVFSRRKFRSNNYAFLIHNLLGDPEFEIWTDTPQCYDDIAITRDNNSFSISGLSDVDSAFVAYVNAEGRVNRFVTHSDTTVLHASPNGSIMIYSHNYIPYIAPMFLQNVNLTQSQYVVASDVTAGYSVDSIRTPGDVIVKNGVEYEIEASGTVTLTGGFTVEKGAIFTVKPACF